MGVCDHSWGLGLYQPVRIPIKRVCGGYYLRWYYNGWHYWFFIPGNYYKVTEGENYRTIGTRKVVLATGQVTLAQAKAIRTIMNTREVYLWTVAGWMNIRIEPGTINVHTNMVNAVEFEIVALIGSKEISLPTGYSPIDDVPDIPPPEFETYCEVAIGNQIWMCKAWDIAWPGFRTYNMDVDNKDIYGGLYTFDMINSPGFCPAGWHVPTLDEWQECIAFIGGLAVAAGKLKEVGLDHWFSPNTGAVDTYGFTQRSTGYSRGLEEFYNLYESAYIWTKTEASRTLGRAVIMSFDSAAITINSIIKTMYCGVRLLKDIPALIDFLLAGTTPNALILRSGDAGLTFTNMGSAGLGNPACFCRLINGDIIYGTHTGWIVNYTKGTSVRPFVYGITAMLAPVNGTLYVGNNNGDLYTSIDGGDTYEYQINRTTIVDIVYTGGDIVTFGSAGIHRTYGDIPPVQAGNFTCGFDAGGGIVYAADTSAHIWKSIDSGASWADLGVKCLGWTVDSMALSPSGRIHIGVSTVAHMLYTDDGFATTPAVFTGKPATSIAVIDATNTIVGTTDGSILLTTDDGASWNGIAGNPQQGETRINCLISV